MSREFTVYQATNPVTAPETLARMATDRPDLRQFVAANPATPASVVEWLGTLGDHAVDAALARRHPPAPPPSAYPPPGPSGHAPSAAPPPTGAPADAQQWGAGGQPWGPSAPGSQPWAGSGPVPSPYAAESGANPYATPAAPYGGAPGYGGGTPAAPDAYGYQLPEPRGRRTGLVVAIVVAAVLLVGALVFVFSSVAGVLSDDSTYGEDPNLDRLWDACDAGDGQACDDLYLESPLGSDYEEFGDTCGHRFPAQEVWCVDVM